MPVRAVIFDFFGTVAYRPGVAGSGFATVFERLGHRLDPRVEAVYFERYDGIEHVEHSSDRTTYDAWAAFRYAELARDCGVPDRDIGTVVEALTALDRTDPIVPYPDAAPTLVALRARGFAVAVCSNWGWDLDRSMSETGLSDLVDVAVTSAQAGARKPHPRIFAAVTEMIGVEPAEALFVGDSVVPDVDGPMQIGMAAAHVWRHRVSFDAPELPVGARRIGSLTELLGWPALARRGAEAVADSQVGSRVEPLGAPRGGPTDDPDRGRGGRGRSRIRRGARGRGPRRGDLHRRNVRGVLTT